MIIQLEIPHVPPSNNEYMGQGNKKAQIVDYQTDKKIWVQELQLLRNNLIHRKKMKLPFPLREATVVTVYHFKNKIRRDPDNYSGKMIHDALVETGFLVDDSFKQVDPFPLAEFGCGQQRTVIHLIPGLLIRDYVEELINPYGQQS